MISSEWLTGTIGLEAYFGLKSPKVAPTQLKQALRAETYIQNRADAWANSKRPARLESNPIPLTQYDQIITSLNHPYQAHPDIRAIPHEFSLDFLTAFLDIGNYLQQHEPSLKISQGFLGREIEPPDSDKIRFLWICNMINDLRRVFDLLDSGALTHVEATTFKELFPETALLTAVTYLRTGINFIYDKQKPTLASWQIAGLSALMGVPVADFNDVVAWQAGYDQSPGPGRPAVAKPVNLADSNLTDSQKLDSPA